MVLQLLVLLLLGLEFAQGSSAEPETACSGSEPTTEEGSGRSLLARGHRREQSATVIEDVATDPPSCLIGQSVYIRSQQDSSKFLSIQHTDVQGDPGVLKTCHPKSPGCMWEILPTTLGRYYLKTSDTDQTLHWTHGNQGEKARGERATLYPCMTGDYNNCKWRFVKLDKDTDEYLIQSSGEDNYLIAPHEGKTSATVDHCDSSNPEPKCVWKVGLTFTSWDFPKSFTEHSVYIQWVDTCLSVQQPDVQGDPGILQRCDPSMKWKIVPTACGQYYLNPAGADQTLHWTHGNQGKKARGEAATLYPCMTGDFDNCKWRFVKLNKDQDKYLIQASGEENYLIAPHDENTLAFVDYCDYSSPKPECVWTVTRDEEPVTVSPTMEPQGDVEPVTVSPTKEPNGDEELVTVSPTTQPEGGHGDCAFMEPHDLHELDPVHNNCPLCADGTIHWHCVTNNHGGRVQCPRFAPYMCAAKACDGGNDYCCEDTEAKCNLFGGLRQCESA